METVGLRVVASYSIVAPMAQAHAEFLVSTVVFIF